MRRSRYGLALALVFCMAPAFAWSDPPALAPPVSPSSPAGDGAKGAILLPPQAFDDSAKAPNTTRERKGEWSIYGGVYFVQPVFQNNAAFIVNAGGGNLTRQVDFNHNLEAAPNVWIGYVSERGWGVRGRWFQFDHGNSIDYTTAPGETITGVSNLGVGRVPVAGTITASSHLAVNVLDFEGTCSIDGPKWSHLLGIGVRYTHMSQDYRATLANPATRIDLTSGHNLNGVGPTFSVETKRRIGESGFAVYGQMHGAIVFGDTKETYTAVNNAVPQQFTRNPTGVLPTGELELGAEYRKNVGRTQAFLQTGFTGQAWWGGGNSSNVDPIGGASASHNNFGFIGLVLRAGVRY